MNVVYWPAPVLSIKRVRTAVFSKEVKNMQAHLILEDGTVINGKAFGSCCDVFCEVVFNTGLTGYLELLTDASYAGQGIIMSTPIVGNYGVFLDQAESDRPWASALIVRDLTHMVADERAAEDLDAYMGRNDVAGLSGVDTRALILLLREKGTMNGLLTTVMPADMPACLASIRAFSNRNPVRRVSRSEIKHFPSGTDGHPTQPEGSESNPAQPSFLVQATKAVQVKKHIAMLDFGLKQSIIRNLTRRGCPVTAYPWDTPAEVILADYPDGLVLSNGPGDPEDCRMILPQIRKLVESGKPIMAICMGHQLLALAHGAKTRKLKYGHRGVNHPVQELATGRVTITSQNHGYVVIEDHLPQEAVSVSHIHLNDGSVEGLYYHDKPIISVQFHPEGAPGPEDSAYLFDRFIAMMAGAEIKDLT
jgi:carbamoyl-phosphate synthase small subunit